jgi:hypothetical protein
MLEEVVPVLLAISDQVKRKKLQSFIYGQLFFLRSLFYILIFPLKALALSVIYCFPFYGFRNLLIGSLFMALAND